MNKEQLKEYLIKVLDEEDKPYGIKEIGRIVDEHTEAYCMQLLMDARKLYSAGILIQDESRPRTIGGCFFLADKVRSKKLK